MRPTLATSVFCTDMETIFISVTAFISWFCSVIGMGKLLALAQSRAWQAWIFALQFSTESLIVCRRARGLMRERRRCAAGCPDYWGPDNMSSFNRLAADSSPTGLCVTSALLRNQVRFNTRLGTRSGRASNMLWMFASATWDPVCWTVLLK